MLEGKFSAFASLWKAYFASSKDTEILLKIWGHMSTARALEEKVALLARENKIEKKWLFSGIGQEGEQAALTTLLSPEDISFGPYRGFAVAISRGVPMDWIVREILGKKTGPYRGLAPATNFTDLDYGIVQQSYILGLDFGRAIGAAVALRNKKSNGIVAVFFGDGSATRGSLWSAVNLSVLWNLPILWVCENNEYSFSTHVSQMTQTAFSEKAVGFGIPAYSIDGTNVVDLYFKAKHIIAKMRDTASPAFLECKNFRIAPHDVFYFNKTSYQKHSEREKWKRRDSWTLLTKTLVDAHKLTKDESDSTQKKITLEIDALFRAISQEENAGETEVAFTTYE